MTSFVVRSLIGLVLLACVSGPAEAWLGTAPAMRIACSRDFAICRIGELKVPVAETSSVLGRIAEMARHDPARHFEAALREIAVAAKETMESARGAARDKVTGGLKRNV